METKERLSVQDLTDLVREHMPGYDVYEHAQIEEMRESLARYGLTLSRRESDMGVAITRLLRVVAIHDAALARKDYETSDAIRTALDVSYPLTSRPNERWAAYRARFDVPMKKRMVHFLATPPKT